MRNAKETIENGGAVLGIEFGSTRIKAVLIDETNAPLASGGFDWENSLKNGIWTYDLSEVISGLQGCYADLKHDVMKLYGAKLTKLAAVGVSGMMHGFLAFDQAGNQLAEYRTWRNTITAQAAEELTELFGYNIPQRWSIAHLYQAILNNESFVKDIASITTLAGYIHRELTGENVMGIGEASGMFPIDTKAHDFNAEMIQKFDEKISPLGLGWKLREILPVVKTAGEAAGSMTPEGAKLIDPSGELAFGAPMCAPEGDAGTGMVATNSTSVRTGNVSAGTSVFAMVVLERELSKVYPEIDLVTTPSGDLVGMVHCNNCTTDLNAWVRLFGETLEAFGKKPDTNELYGTLYQKALEADENCGELLSYNYYSGEHITGFEEGRPLLVRKPSSKFSLANLMRTHLFTALGALKIGLNIMLEQEGVRLDLLYGHGGFFKTKGVGQSVMAACAGSAVAVMETAGEGGAWGIALLARYLVCGAEKTLPEFLSTEVFAEQKGSVMQPDEALSKSFAVFMQRYVKGLPIERAAVDVF